MSVKPRFHSRTIGALLLLSASLTWLSTLAHSVDGGEQPHRSAGLTDGHPSDDVRALIRAFRQTGDDRNLETAWNRLRPVLEHGTQDVFILIDAATVAQARHDFDAALALIDRALIIQPGLDQAWLLRASIELVRGNPDEAEAACDRLRSVPTFIAVTCRARVAIARGGQTNTPKMLEAVLATIHKESANPEALAWTLSVAGDAAADPEAAIAYYEKSLEIVESTQVRAALVDVLLASGRVTTARAVLESGHDALPLAVRRLIVAVRMGDTDTVREEIARTDHEFRHWIAEQDWAHAREMARFYIDVLDQPDVAKRLARINLRFQREPEDLLLARRVEECSSCVP